MALTRKTVAYIAIAYCFVALALLLRASLLTVFVIPTAVFFFLSSRLVPFQSVHLRVSRKINPLRSFVGEDIDVTVTLFNDSPMKVENLYLEDKVPESLVVQSGMRLVPVSLNENETCEYRYRILSPARGTYTLGPAAGHIVDTLGFRDQHLEVGDDDELRVLPRIDDVGILDIRAGRVGPWPGLVPSRKIGIGTEFFELGIYTPGDELRRINWKASAKLRQLVTNEFEGEQVTDVLVLLDCSQGVQSKLFDFDALEFQVSLAASLCSQLILQGNRVGLSVYGAIRTWVDLAFGRRQLLRLLDNLAIVRPGRTTIPMDYAVQSVILAIVPARAVIVVVSPITGDEIVDTVANLAARGYRIICFTPTAKFIREGTSDARLMAERILTVERRVRMMQVARVARVVEVTPHMATKSIMRRGTLWRPA